MKLLLDTHALLWFQSGDRRVSTRARRAIESPANELFMSAATVWEMAIKSSLGRLTVSAPVESYVAEKLSEGYRMLSITAVHAARVERLEWHHRDPFDRLLIAQALAERCVVVTRDRVFGKYGVEGTVVTVISVASLAVSVASLAAGLLS